MNDHVDVLTRPAARPAPGAPAGPRSRIVTPSLPVPAFPRRVARRVGRALRAWVWRRRLAEFGTGSAIARAARVLGGAGISVGAGVTIWPGARIEVLAGTAGRIRLSIGNGTRIHSHVHIGVVERIRIGAGVLMAAHVYITDHDHDWSNPDEPVISNGRVVVAPVDIGDYVWLGERVMVLKGVRIGARSIIGAGSIVTRDIPPACVAVGAPARVIRRWDPASRTWLAVGAA